MSKYYIKNDAGDYVLPNGSSVSGNTDKNKLMSYKTIRGAGYGCRAILNKMSNPIPLYIVDQTDTVISNYFAI